MSKAHIISLERDGRAICGEKIGTDFHFRSIDQAAINARHGGIDPCSICTIMTANLLLDSLLTKPSINS